MKLLDILLYLRCLELYLFRMCIDYSLVFSYYIEYSQAVTLLRAVLVAGAGAGAI